MIADARGAGRAPSSLPVLDVIDDVRAALAEPGAAVLLAPPGTGKTTGVAPALLDETWAAHGRIIVLEPRRLAARAATRMAQVHGTAVGETFGYAVRGERRVGSTARVEVVTGGLFLRRLQSDPGLDGVCAVFLDEFHERSLDTDLVLALLLDVRSSLRPDLRLLVMSATLDAEPVARLLSRGSMADGVDPRDTTGAVGGGADGRPVDAVPIIEAVAPMFPVETRYRPGSAHDPLEDRVAEVVAEALRADPGDVLVFLPGRPEIHRVRRSLERRRIGIDPDRGVAVLDLHGSLSPAEQESVIGVHPDGRRRIVLSTSLAETSITVPGVRVVVDAGRRRAVRTDPHTGLPALTTGPVSRAGADQRRGRAGRTAPGVTYRLWGQEDERHRPAADTPEVLDGDLAPLVLQLRAWGVEDPSTLGWLDPPPTTGLVHAEELLELLGAIDATGRLTNHGRELAEIGFHPRLAAVASEGRSLSRPALAAEVVAVLETSRSGEVDVVERVRELGAGRASGDAQHSLRQWRRTLGVDGGGGRGGGGRRGRATDSGDDQPDDLVARLLLAGYPDRVARRRSAARTDARGRSRTVFHLRSGGEVALPVADHHFETTTWMVVADLDGGAEARSGRLHLGASVADDTLREVLGDQIQTEEVVEWNPRRRTLDAVRRRRLGAITFDEQPWRDPPRVAMQAALTHAIADEGLGLLGRLRDADPLRARVGLLHAVNAPSDGGQAWPDWSDQALTETLDEWLGPFLDRARSLKDLQRIDVRQALESQLTWDQTRQLPEAAPTHWRLPSGKKIPLRYGEVDGEPATVLASVRLRELIGTDVHPTVAGGRVRVSVELLSPAGRPVQRTTDLPGFWRGSYADVRAELRGRYPKHPWPEHPWEPLPARPPRPKG